MVDTQTFQVFDSWILPIGMSSCPGRLQKKEGQTLTTFRCIHVATYYGKMGQLSGCGLLTCMVQQTKPHLVAHNEPDLEETEELDGPALFCYGLLRRERYNIREEMVKKAKAVVRIHVHAHVHR